LTSHPQTAAWHTICIYARAVVRTGKKRIFDTLFNDFYFFTTMDVFALNTLYIVRHGIAEEGFGKPDAERELVEEGRRKVHENGKHLLNLGVQPDVIVSSPYKRALQTAQILAGELGYKGDILLDDRITPMGRYEGFSDLFTEVRSNQTIMLVGHEPNVSSLVASICAGNQLRMNFKKGAVACIAIDRLRPVQGALLWYAPSSVLQA
jgi:phosphohistidine phosphatase